MDCVTQIKILDILNLNATNTIIERSDGVNIVIKRAYTLAGDDKDAFTFLITLFKSKTSIATYYLLNRVQSILLSANFYFATILCGNNSIR